MSPWALNRLTHAIAAGAVIGYPTDTIWGFGCDPLNPVSVARLLQIKQRPVDKGLILLTSQLLYCEPFIRLTPEQRVQLQSPCTTPTTLQMRRQFGDEVDYIVTGFNSGGARPSAIKSLASGNLLRSG